MAFSAQGDPVRGEVSSANASAGVAVTLYNAGTVTPAITIGTEDYFTLTDLIFISTAGGAYVLAGTADAAGKRFVRGNADAKGGLAHHWETPLTFPKGVTPVLIADSGQVDVSLSGYITRG